VEAPSGAFVSIGAPAVDLCDLPLDTGEELAPLALAERDARHARRLDLGSWRAGRWRGVPIPVAHGTGM
jgi:hypothetical protein